MPAITPTQRAKAKAAAAGNKVQASTTTRRRAAGRSATVERAAASALAKTKQPNITQGQAAMAGNPRTGPMVKTNSNWRKAAATPRTQAQQGRDRAMAAAARTGSTAQRFSKAFVKSGGSSAAVSSAQSDAAKARARAKKKAAGSRAPATRKRKTGPQ